MQIRFRVTPSFEEFRQIIDNVRTQRHSADAADSADFLELMGLPGVGQAEIAGLTRADFDFEEGRIDLFGTIQ